MIMFFSGWLLGVGFGFFIAAVITIARDGE